MLSILCPSVMWQVFEALTFVGWRDGIPAPPASAVRAVNRRNPANIPSRGGLWTPHIRSDLTKIPETTLF